MANNAFSPDLTLSADQENLLRTALSSNPRGSPQTPSMNVNGINGHQRNGSLTSPMSNDFTSPNQDVGQMTDSPLFDDVDASFDEQLFDDLHDDYDENGDIHDKRKVSTGSDQGEASKRQEGDTKTPKKPGRKPLTAEPTTVSRIPFVRSKTLNWYRNAKRRIELLSAHFASGKIVI